MKKKDNSILKKLKMNKDNYREREDYLQITRNIISSFF